MPDTGFLAQKLTFTFAKLGRARFHSHHDLMRHFERAVRRAGLPARETEGFNPRPRLVFPHALGVGVASRCEEVELELWRKVEPSVAAEALRSAVSPVVEILAWRVLPPVRKGRQVKRAHYRVSGWPAGLEPAALAAELLAAETILVKRGAPGQERELDARPFVEGARAEGRELAVTLTHGDTGTGRIDELAGWLATRHRLSPADLSLERVALEWA